MAKKAMSEAHRRAISRGQKRRYAAKKRTAPARTAEQPSNESVYTYVLTRTPNAKLFEELGRRLGLLVK